MNEAAQSYLNKSRIDKFLVVLTVPNVLKKINNTTTRSNSTFNFDSLEFSVYGTIVPRIQVPPIETKYGGSTIQLSSHVHPTYAPVTFSFAIDNEFKNYWMIYTWLNVLRDQKEGVYGIVDTNELFNKNMNLADYSVDMSVIAVDEFNKPKIEFVYKSAFPVSLGEINFNYQESNEIQSTVEFAFHELNIELRT